MLVSRIQDVVLPLFCREIPIYSRILESNCPVYDTKNLARYASFERYWVCVFVVGVRDWGED